MKTFILGFIYSHNPFNSYTILGKGKYKSHTIACLIIYTHAFCHICDENLLKQGFLNSGKGWVVIENFAGGGIFFPGGENLQRSDFDDLNLLQS